MKRVDVIHIENWNDVVLVSNKGVEGSYRIELKGGDSLTNYNEIHLHIDRATWRKLVREVRKLQDVH